jgi:hypothetical protein
MRKIDKKLNLKKVNLLAENRYLESKGFGMEGFEPQESMAMPEEGYMEEMAVKKPSAQANNMIKMISTFTNTTPEMADGDVKFINQNGETVFFVSPENGVVSLLPPDEIHRMFKEKLNQLMSIL